MNKIFAGVMMCCVDRIGCVGREVRNAGQMSRRKRVVGGREMVWAEEEETLIIGNIRLFKAYFQVCKSLCVVDKQAANASCLNMDPNHLA